MGKERETRTTPVIEPIYSQTEPNQPISIGSIPVQLTCGNKTHRHTAEVTIRFVPDYRLTFKVHEQAGPLPLGARITRNGKWDRQLQLPGRNVSIEVLCAIPTVGSRTAVTTFVPTRSAVTVTKPSKVICTAKFHLFNFPPFSAPSDYILASSTQFPGSLQVCGRAILKGDGWNITLAATDKTAPNLSDALRNEGGYLITHMGSIEREDGSKFTSSQLEDILSCVHYFLSFALGRWAGLALPIGFNKSAKRVFEQWGLRLTAAGPWGGSCSWFDAHHAGCLSEVFPGFLALWKDPAWNRSLREVLYWYIGANERGLGIGVDAGLILAQAALERLAWTHCVQVRGMVSEKAFRPRGLSAADRLRLLASSLDIPLGIPACLSALRATPGRQWEDSMDAITEIRNVIVHPHLNKKLPDGAYFEGWKLSLWYIDLVLLRLCGHTGEYANRLPGDRWVGQVEKVPWANE